MSNIINIHAHSESIENKQAENKINEMAKRIAAQIRPGDDIHLFVYALMRTAVISHDTNMLTGLWIDFIQSALSEEIIRLPINPSD